MCIYLGIYFTKLKQNVIANFIINPLVLHLKDLFKDFKSNVRQVAHLFLNVYFKLKITVLICYDLIMSFYCF
jgi:hypothetical protein